MFLSHQPWPVYHACKWLCNAMRKRRHAVPAEKKGTPSTQFLGDCGTAYAKIMCDSGDFGIFHLSRRAMKCIAWTSFASDPNIAVIGVPVWNDGHVNLHGTIWHSGGPCGLRNCWFVLLTLGIGPWISLFMAAVYMRVKRGVMCFNYAHLEGIGKARRAISTTLKDKMAKANIGACLGIISCTATKIFVFARRRSSIPPKQELGGNFKYFCEITIMNFQLSFSLLVKWNELVYVVDRILSRHWVYLNSGPLLVAQRLPR